MSFILDALKKSESDRQRQSGPSLFEVKVAPPRRRLPVWAVAIAILLLVNFIVLSWMLLRHPAAQQQAVTAGAPATSPPATAMVGQPVAADATRMRPSGGGPAPAGGATAAEAGAAREAAPSAGSSLGATSSAPSQPAVTAPLATADADRVSPPATSTAGDDAPAIEPAPAPGSGGAAGTAADLPLYQQIVTSDGLPPLHLDLHVFADRPGDRFVMVNMHRLGEGDALPNGVQVEAIRPDGVVMTYRGTRFLLPRN
jgi:general secretion pathway protein B